MQNLLLQPGPAIAHPGTDGHQQRHGVAHVVVGLRKKSQVPFPAQMARERILDDRYREQNFTIRCSFFSQGRCKAHWLLP